MYKSTRLRIGLLYTFGGGEGGWVCVATYRKLPKNAVNVNVLPETYIPSYVTVVTEVRVARVVTVVRVVRKVTVVTVVRVVTKIFCHYFLSLIYSCIKQLKKLSCLSVGRSVSPSVCPSVRPSVRLSVRPSVHQ